MDSNEKNILNSTVFTTSEKVLLMDDRATELLQKVTLAALDYGAKLQLDESDIPEIESNGYYSDSVTIRTSDADIWAMYNFFKRGLDKVAGATLRVTELCELVLEIA